jgi:hypothetical protein
MPASYASVAGLPDFSWYMIRKQEKMYHMNTKCTNGYKISQMSVNYSKWAKINQHFPIKGPQKFTQIGIFGLKTNHLATLIRNKWQKQKTVGRDKKAKSKEHCVTDRVTG